MNKTDAERILELRDELTRLSYSYYLRNNPEVPDDVYDAKFRELLQLEKDHPEMRSTCSPTLRIGSPIPTGMLKVTHKVKMLSLQNTNSMDEVMKFFPSMGDKEITLEMKIDGLSLHLSYVKGRLVKAITRGDGVVGADVTENARTIPTIPLILNRPVDIEVRGEVYWQLSSFERYNASLPEDDRMSNARNGASGTMQLKDSMEVARRRLTFVAYSAPTDLPEGVKTQEGLLDYLECLGFTSTMSLPPIKDLAGLPYTTCMGTRDELETAIAYLDAYRADLDLVTDGLVLKVSSLALQRDLGEGVREPHWAAAYKFPPEIKETRLNAIMLQVGKSGQITPVAVLEPVSLGGTTVRKASLCNQEEMDRLGIDVGDYVFVQRSGEVIPKVIGLSKPSLTKSTLASSFQMPRTCPCCSTPLEKAAGMVHYYCPNSDCADQVCAKLVYATGKEALDIDGCGDAMVKTMMSKKGVKKLSDVFALKEFSFLKPAAARKLKDGLEIAKKAPLWRKLMALSIDGFGKVTCQSVANKFHDLCAILSEENAEAVKTMIGGSALTSLISFVESDASFEELEALTGLGFCFHEDAGAGGPLSGKTFCITGALMSGRRDDVSAMIEKHGGVVKGSVGKTVEYLVQGEGGGNNKAAAAEKYGTTIITEEELYTMAGEVMPLMHRNLEP